MKKTFRMLTSLFMAIMIAAAMAVPAFAAKTDEERLTKLAEDLKKSVVYIDVDATYTAKNKRTQIDQGWSGTGFAVGEVGKPVQYIATAAHVADGAYYSGVYKATVSKDSNGKQSTSLTKLENNTAYPQEGTDNDGNTYYVDYFECDCSLTAYYSKATDDKVKLTLANSITNRDVSLCKIASDPTDKLAAIPLRKAEKVSSSERGLIAIGYPGIARDNDAERKMDQAAAMVTFGSMMNKQQIDEKISGNKTYEALAADINVAPGNSGGPLFDSHGAAIGVCSFGNSAGNVPQEVNYFTPTDNIMTMMRSLNAPYTDADDATVNYALIIILSCIAVALVVALVMLLAVHNKKNQSTVNTSVNGDETKALPINQNAAAFGNDIGVTKPETGVKKMYLIGKKGYFEGKKYSIEDRVVIGRDNSRCNVVFPADQPGVSTVHCEILVNNGMLFIKDCNSTYGTYLSDGKKITPNMPVMIRSGAQFWVGSKDVVFEVKY